MQRKRSVWLVSTLLFALGLLSLCLPQECPAQTPLSLYETTIASTEALEAQMLQMTNQNRIQQGLLPLFLDETLMRIARKQSSGMADQGFLSHVLPSGDLQARMDLEGYRYSTVRENIAQSSSLIRAYRAFLDSPSHKANLLAPDVSQVGIGIVRCPPPYEKEMFITEIFASPRKATQPVEVRNVLLDQIEDLRKKGIGTLAADPFLEKLASDSVQAFDVDAPGEDFRHIVTNSTDDLQKNGFSRVNISVQLLRDPKNLKVVSQGYGGRNARGFGAAIRRVNSHRESAFLVLTLIGFAN